MPRHDQARILGAGAQESIEVLETTGVVRGEGDQILPCCELFRIWAEQTLPRPAHGPPPSDRRLREAAG